MPRRAPRPGAAPRPRVPRALAARNRDAPAPSPGALGDGLLLVGARRPEPAGAPRLVSRRRDASRAPREDASARARGDEPRPPRHVPGIDRGDERRAGRRAMDRAFEGIG